MKNLPTRPLRIAQPGLLVLLGRQQQPRNLDASGRQDHNLAFTQNSLPPSTRHPQTADCPRRSFIPTRRRWQISTTTPVGFHLISGTAEEHIRQHRLLKMMVRHRRGMQPPPTTSSRQDIRHPRSI